MRTRQAYAADHTVRHIDKRKNVKYVVRWYSYTYPEDTSKPRHHIH